MSRFLTHTSPFRLRKPKGGLFFGRRPSCAGENRVELTKQVTRTVLLTADVKKCRTYMNIFFITSPPTFSYPGKDSFPHYKLLQLRKLSCSPHPSFFQIRGGQTSTKDLHKNFESASTDSKGYGEEGYYS